MKQLRDGLLDVSKLSFHMLTRMADERLTALTPAERDSLQGRPIIGGELMTNIVIDK